MVPCPLCQTPPTFFPFISLFDQKKSFPPFLQHISHQKCETKTKLLSSSLSFPPLLVGTRVLQTLWSPPVSLNQETHTQRRKAANFIFILYISILEAWGAPAGPVRAAQAGLACPSCHVHPRLARWVHHLRLPWPQSANVCDEHTDKQTPHLREEEETGEKKGSDHHRTCLYPFGFSASLSKG